MMSNLCDRCGREWPVGYRPAPRFSVIMDERTGCVYEPTSGYHARPQ